MIGDNGLQTKPGDNSKYAKIMLEIMSWPEVDRSDVNALEERLKEYVRYCVENDLKIGNQACYLALGISKDDVYNWENGVSRTSAHCDFIKKVKKICAGTREFLMQDGKINPITGIFWQKNYDGLRDQQEFIVTPNNPLGAELTPEQIKQQLPPPDYGDE